MRVIIKGANLLTFTIIILLGLVCIAPLAQAAGTTSLHIDEKTIIKGYTVNHLDGDFLFAVTPNQVDQTVTVELKEIGLGSTPTPDGKVLVSGVFQHDMIGDVSNPIIVKRPSYTAIRYDSDNDQAKSIYVWDRNKEDWIMMPSKIDTANNYVRAITHLPFGQVAVFEDEIEVYEGIATWYEAGQNHTAACNIFPMNSLVKVTALSSGKTTVVRVADTGAFSSNIVIDLDTSAFEDLAPLGAGIVNVKIELADEEDEIPPAEDELDIS